MEKIKVKKNFLPIPRNAKWNGFEKLSKKDGKQFFWHIDSLIKRRYNGTIVLLTQIPIGRKKKACNLRIEYKTKSGATVVWDWNNIPYSCILEDESGLYVECRFAKQFTTPSVGKYHCTKSRIEDEIVVTYLKKT